MCRSIKPLRRSVGAASEEEIHEAALQYVRKVSGFRAPSAANARAVDEAVASVARASRLLLDALPPKKATRPRVERSGA